MDEQQWLTAVAPGPLAEWLNADRQTPADREWYTARRRWRQQRLMRLFACACHRASAEPKHAAVLSAEWFADIEGMTFSSMLEARHDACVETGWLWCATCPDIAVALHSTLYWHTNDPPPAVQVALLRDVVGNPFRPATPPWLTRPAIDIARAIYDDHRFEDLPILADALEEAGCADAAVLGHCRETMPCPRGCRSDGVGADYDDRVLGRCSICQSTGLVPAMHARGCWVLDLVLDKE